MSTSPEFDLEQLFLPSWAKQTPDANRFARYKGDEEVRGGRRREGGDFRDRPPRRDVPGGGGRGPQQGRGGRPGGGDRRPGGDRGPRRDAFPRPEEKREPVVLPEVEVSLLPEAKGVESIGRQIKLTGRAYPLFDVAQLLLKKPDRYDVKFSVVKKADGTIAQQLFLCNLDDSLWLSENDAVQHVLAKHFATFYSTEKIATEPPKGVYTFVAQCGMSGVILGPPNYHDYQTKLHRLHNERFSRLPFEAFKARVKIVKDEVVVKQWLDEQSFKTMFTSLNVPEPVQLASRDEVERHFRATHLANIIKPVDSHLINGAATQTALNGALRSLYRREYDDQSRFPIKLVTALSQSFASQGLHFFKVNKTVTHVSVARPRYLDVAATPVSPSLQRLIDFINATPKCTRRKLLDGLAPAPVAAAPAPAPAPVEGAAPAAPAAPVEAAPTPQQSAVITDLHWLIHQGHVIEFANGIIETAKKPAPKPVKQAPAKPAVAPAAKGIAAAPSAPAAEAPAESATEVVEEAETSEVPAAPAAPAAETPATPPTA